MRNHFWLIASVLLTLTFMLWKMPASWAIQNFMGPRDDVAFKGVQGSIWDGNAKQVSVVWDGERYSLGKVEWNWRPKYLLRLQACVDFVSRLDSQVFEGTACRHSGGDWSLLESEFRAPASLAQLFLPIQVKGNLRLHIDRLTFDRGRVTNLDAHSQWHQAAFHNSQTWLSLGHLVGKFSSDASGTITVDIADIDGPMTINLILQSPYQQSTHVAGEIELKPEAPQELGQLLQVFGFTRRGDSFDVAWSF